MAAFRIEYVVYDASRMCSSFRCHIAKQTYGLLTMMLEIPFKSSRFY